MTYRAHVVYRDLPRDALAVAIGRKIGDQKWQAVISINGQGVTQEIHEPHVDGPTLLIPTDVAIVLLDALSQHFGGTSDVRQLRADYDAERLRVDRMQTTISRIAMGAGRTENKDLADPIEKGGLS